MHFTLSSAAYSGLLYSRNMLVTLFAGRVVAHHRRIGRGPDRPAGSGWPPPRPGRSSGSACRRSFRVHRRDRRSGSPPPSCSHNASTTGRRRAFLRLDHRYSRRFVAFASAPLWYFAARQLRVVLGELVDLRELPVPRDRTEPRARSCRGRQQLLRLLPASPGAVRHDRRVRGRHDRRVARGSIARCGSSTWPSLGWFAGGWFQLVSGERYSTHYFSVIAAPTR